MKTIDARGFECPMPVIMAKREIRDGADKLLVQVDNEVSTQNLKKMAEQTGFEVEITKIAEDDYKVEFSRVSEAEIFNPGDEYIVVMDSNKLGEGDEDFAKTLVESFLLALTEQDTYPAYIIFYNSGVELTTINKKTVEDIKKLEAGGVEVLSCGLCLDFYEVKDQLKVGEITNMYRIVELLTSYRVVRP